MNRFYLATTLIVIFLTILSLTRLRIRLKYLRRGKDDEFALEFSLWRGLVVYKFEIPVVKLTKKKAKRSGFKLRKTAWPVPGPVFKIKAQVEGKGGRPLAEEKTKVQVPGPARLLNLFLDTVRLIKRYSPAVKYLLRNVHLQQLRWRTEFGTGDPSQTGFVAGLAWGAKGVTLSVVYRLLHRGGARPEVTVAPVFNGVCFSTWLDCIFEVRIGYIIFTGFKTLYLRFK